MRRCLWPIRIPNYSYWVCAYDINDISEYLERASGIYFGINPSETKQLAYQYAKALNPSCHKTWEENKSAGCDRLRGFLKRNPRPSTRKLQTNSVARASSFHSYKVSVFFDLLSRQQSTLYTAAASYTGPAPGLPLLGSGETVPEGRSLYETE